MYINKSVTRSEIFAVCPPSPLEIQVYNICLKTITYVSLFILTILRSRPGFRVVLRVNEITRDLSGDRWVSNKREKKAIF